MTVYELAQRLAKKQGLDPEHVYVLVLRLPNNGMTRVEAWHGNPSLGTRVLAQSEFTSSERFSTHGLRRVLLKKLEDP